MTVYRRAAAHSTRETARRFLVRNSCSTRARFRLVAQSELHTSKSYPPTALAVRSAHFEVWSKQDALHRLLPCSEPRPGLAAALDESFTAMTQTMPFFCQTQPLEAWVEVIRREYEIQTLKSQIECLKREYRKLVRGIRTLPRELACPISLEVMIDPVIAADGYSYDRDQITVWLRGHDTSPLTLTRLAHKELIPNLALRSLIGDYLERLDIPLEPPDFVYVEQLLELPPLMQQFAEQVVVV
eukprot:TRINITY_DN9937_c0_g1_i1.p1 TRINITY_DN9937_c0_g1~~TRINITY_DN9937_c0_g1_i1.p1  ORF type:complete len:272 (-),score=33.24 TRINITY_DN9937_c0_g1_i1:203-928(-)